MIAILRSAQDQPPISSARAAIVTLLVGEAYERTWSRVCAPSWISYARRTGVDIVILTDRIDPSDVARSPAWQKLLILDLPWAKRYERVIWLDCDIIINEEAPDILQYGGEIEKVGICADSGCLSPSEAQVYLEGKTKHKFSPREVLTTWPLAMQQTYIRHHAPPHDVLFNTGVMVLSPAHHNETLRSVYRCPQISHLCEQPQLSHRLLENDLVHVLSPRYNWGVIEPIELIFNNGAYGDESPQFIARIMHIIVRSQLKAAYFLHFYGAMTLLMRYAENAPASDMPAVAAE
jgi:hypothetical protein